MHLQTQKYNKKRLKQLRRQQRKVSRCKKGSANRRKAVARLRRIHAKIANIRQNSLHQLTHLLTKTFSLIGIEDLNVKGMLKNGKLSRAIADLGFYEFKRQLLYKAKLRGVKVHVADRFFPSSKLCSCCQHKNEMLTLAERMWECRHCGAIHDRDVNAAINLVLNAVSCTVSACGEEGSGLIRKVQVKPASAKQELNTGPSQASA